MISFRVEYLMVVSASSWTDLGNGRLSACRDEKLTIWGSIASSKAAENPPPSEDSNMFHIEDQGSAQRQGAWHRAPFHLPGWPIHGCLHGLSTVGLRVLQSLQHHMPPPTLGGLIVMRVHFRHSASTTRGGQEDDLALVRGKNAQTARPEAHSRDDYDQLAILGLLDPKSQSLDDRYGLEGLCPEETLGALALEGPRTASTRWLTRLAPRDCLAALGLIHDSDIR